MCFDTAAGDNPGSGVDQQQRKIGSIATPSDSLFQPQICPNKWSHLQFLCSCEETIRANMLESDFAAIEPIQQAGNKIDCFWT
jgi:hypothetical protein